MPWYISYLSHTMFQSLIQHQTAQKYHTTEIWHKNITSSIYKPSQQVGSGWAWYWDEAVHVIVSGLGVGLTTSWCSQQASTVVTHRTVYIHCNVSNIVTALKCSNIIDKYSYHSVSIIKDFFITLEETYFSKDWILNTHSLHTTV